MNFNSWEFAGLLIALGISHEMSIYILQLRWKVYSRLFKKHGFLVSAIQLGSVWVMIGLMLIVLFFTMDHFSWHQSISVKITGLFVVCFGLVLMFLSWRDLGWQRVMKVRLFTTPEPDWVTHGIFQYLQNPMYRGSQLVMFGLSLVFDSVALLFFTLEMILLQQIQSNLENQKLDHYH